MEKENRTCKEICKKFIVKKPPGGSRYGAGQGRCQTCDVWIDHRGAHMKDGSPAAIDSVGWFCDCCNYRIRQKPRNKIYKEKLRDKSDNLENIEEENVLIDQTEKNLNSENPTDWLKAANEIKKQLKFNTCTQCEKNNHCGGQGSRCNCKCVTVTIGDKNNKVNEKKEVKKIKKQVDYGNVIESTKENEGNIKFFKGIHDTKNNIKNDYNIENECQLLIKNYKKRTSISQHNIGLMEDMIEAYAQIGSLRKLCQETELDIFIVRNGFRNLSRVPTELRELVIDDKLIADPILASEIAVYATDYFEWDQEEDNTNEVIIFAKKIAQKFKETLELRSEFFATKDDYSKPISASSKKNNELNAILEDWPVKKSKYEFNRFTDRTGRQYNFIVKFSKDLDAARFLRRWEYEKGRRISKRWASEMIDQIKNQGNAKEFVKDHSNEFND
ncbi:MAG: hypothetical protein ACW9XH_08010 [Candidatus Nitrosopumilus sp. bin_32a]